MEFYMTGSVNKDSLQITQTGRPLPKLPIPKTINAQGKSVSVKSSVEAQELDAKVKEISNKIFTLIAKNSLDPVEFKGKLLELGVELTILESELGELAEKQGSNENINTNLKLIHTVNELINKHMGEESTPTNASKPNPPPVPDRSTRKPLSSTVVQRPGRSVPFKTSANKYPALTRKEAKNLSSSATSSKLTIKQEGALSESETAPPKDIQNRSSETVATKAHTDSASKTKNKSETDQINKVFNKKKGSLSATTFDSFQKAVKKAVEDNKSLYCIKNNLVASSEDELVVSSEGEVEKNAVKVPTIVLCRIASEVEKECPLSKELISNLNKLNKGNYKRYDKDKAKLESDKFNQNVLNASFRNESKAMISGGTGRNTIACKCLDSIAKLMSNDKQLCKIMDCEFSVHMKVTAGQHSNRTKLISLSEHPLSENLSKYMQDVGSVSNTAPAQDHIVRCLENLSENLKNKLGKKSPKYLEFETIRNRLKELVDPGLLPTETDLKMIDKELKSFKDFVMNIYPPSPK
jgi:hypothetical protein